MAEELHTLDVELRRVGEQMGGTMNTGALPAMLDRKLPRQADSSIGDWPAD
jgi:hypothetical protein